jgi:fatty-acyl-CoA synthase
LSTSSSEYLPRYRSIVDALAAAPDRQPFVTMWRDDEDVESVDFELFRRRAAFFAYKIAHAGADAGDRIILIMPQGIGLMTAFVGAMSLGAVPAILAYPNFKVSPEKYRAGLQGVARNLKARMVVVDSKFPEPLLQLIERDKTGGTVILRTDRETCTRESNERFAPSGGFAETSLAFIQHSAGTTGLQKGVALSHGAVLRQLANLSERLMLTPRDKIYSWLPLYHDMGLIACFMLPLVYHLPVVMQAPDLWVIQPRTMVELIDRHRCTLAWVPNFTLQFLARRMRPEERAAADLSSLRLLINCSEPVRARSHDEFLAAFASSGLRSGVLQASYAMAENVFAVTQSNPASADGPTRLWVEGERFMHEQVAVPVAPNSPGALCLVSSGSCLRGNEVRIVSPEDGAPVAEGKVGEILIRSDSLFDGYYNRPDLTAGALRDGWYWSGDMGFLWQGELFVTGRRKDLIIVAGKNIQPVDVEEAVAAHDQIQDGRAVALGFFNPRLGTEDLVVVAEVKNPQALTQAEKIEREIRNLVAGSLDVQLKALFLKPPRWIIKSTAGKPARSATREKLFAEHPELASEQGE